MNVDADLLADEKGNVFPPELLESPRLGGYRVLAGDQVGGQVLTSAIGHQSSRHAPRYVEDGHCCPCDGGAGLIRNNPNDAAQVALGPSRGAER